MERKIIQFQALQGGDILILLDNGKIFRKTENGGPYYWIEEKLLEDLVKDLGKSEIEK